jgi:hypothetical protein
MAAATAIAIGGLAISGVSTAMSFMQAEEQKSKARQAEADAAAAMAEARRKLEINYAEERAIQKEPYELAREASLSSGAQILQAGRESDRGAEVSAGRVQMAQNEAQAGIRTEMGKELTDIQKDIINEESRLRDLGFQLDTEEAAGAQMAARDAEEASAAATAQGFQGLSSMAQQGLGMASLYGKSSPAANFDSTATTSANKDVINNVNPAFQSSASNQFGQVDYNSMKAQQAAQTFGNSVNPFMPYGVQAGAKTGQIWQDSFANPFVPRRR